METINSFFQIWFTLHFLRSAHLVHSKRNILFKFYTHVLDHSMTAWDPFRTHESYFAVHSPASIICKHTHKNAAKTFYSLLISVSLLSFFLSSNRAEQSETSVYSSRGTAYFINRKTYKIHSCSSFIFYFLDDYHRYRTPSPDKNP